MFSELIMFSGIYNCPPKFKCRYDNEQEVKEMKYPELGDR